MSTPLVTLDPGSFQPFADTSAQPTPTSDNSASSFRAGSGTPQTVPADTPVGQTSGTGQQLDAGSFQPLDASGLPTPAPQPTTWDKVKNALKQSMVGQLASSVFNDPQNAEEAAAHASGGDVGLFALRTARGVINASKAMEKSTGDAYQKAKDEFQNAAIDYLLSSDSDKVMSGHKHDAIMHAVSGVADLAGATAPTQQAQAPTSEGSDITEGSTAGKDLVTPLTRGVVDVATLGATAAAPEVAARVATPEVEVAPAAASETTGSLLDKGKALYQEVKQTPVEAKVADATSKAGISEGTPETVAPAADDIQPALHQGVRDFANNVAKKAGVEAPDAATPIRDVVDKVADSILDKAKDAFSQIDEASGGKFQANKNAIDAVNKGLRNAETEDALTKLQTEKDALLQKQQAIFDEAAKNGVPKSVVDTATSSYKQAQAGYDTSAAIRIATKSRPVNGAIQDVTNINQLGDRLQKLSDAGRLQQFADEDAASALTDHIQNGQLAEQAIKDFVPKSATGQQALKTVISNNTAGKTSLARLGKTVGNTDWNGVVKDFENLGAEGPKAAFGNELPQVRQYIQRQALKQNAKDLILGKTTAGKLLRGAATEEVVRRVI